MSSVIKKMKIFYWNNIGSTVSNIRNDFFTKQDVGSRFIGIFTGKVYDGLSIDIDVIGETSTTKQTFTSTISSGYAEFELNLDNTTDTNFSFVIKIKDSDVIASSQIVKFNIIDCDIEKK